jgi:hypothetical protein
MLQRIIQTETIISSEGFYPFKKAFFYFHFVAGTMFKELTTDH